MTARDPFDTLAPEFTLRVNGTVLPNGASADLIQLSVLDDVDAPGMFAVTLRSLVIDIQYFFDVFLATRMQQSQATNILYQSGQKPVGRIDLLALTFGQ